MKAIVYEAYGSPDVLQFKDMPQPVPGDKDVLVRIHASTVTSGDSRLRSLKVPLGFGLMVRLMLGWSKPRKPIPGCEFAGVVAATGKDVTRFKAGDKVYGFSGMTSNRGANAEYLCIPEKGALCALPDNLSFEEAAAVPFGGMTALHFLKKKLGSLQGKKILINGASGSVGVFAV